MVRRRLTQYKVRVGSSESEGAHARIAWSLALRPWSALSRDSELCLLDGNMRIPVLEVQMWWDTVMPQGERCLYQAGDAGSSLQMPDVRLYGSHQTGRRARACLPIDRLQRAHFDGITEGGARAVRFHID